MNILMFGPNGSGKGTQGALIKKAFGLAHIESGAIFREHVGGGTAGCLTVSPAISPRPNSCTRRCRNRA